MFQHLHKRSYQFISGYINQLCGCIIELVNMLYLDNQVNGLFFLNNYIPIFNQPLITMNKYYQPDRDIDIVELIQPFHYF